jgi:hypothetical protein
MTRPIVLAGTKRGRANLNWGKPLSAHPALLTEFEIQVERLGLAKAEYVGSDQLRHWCSRNRNRCYVPEELLEAWALTVNAIFTYWRWKIPKKQG